MTIHQFYCHYNHKTETSSIHIVAFGNVNNTSHGSQGGYGNVNNTSPASRGGFGNVITI